MSNEKDLNDKQRRAFVKLAGTTAVVLPLGMLGACSGDEKKAESTAAAAKADVKASAAEATEQVQKAAATTDEMAAKVQQEAEQATEMVKEKVADVKSAANDLPKLSEDNTMAKALNYKHDAAAINADKFPGRGAAGNEYCHNCALYTATNEAWGVCPLFAGKLVAGEGWCSSYARKG